MPGGIGKQAIHHRSLQRYSISQISLSLSLFYFTGDKNFLNAGRKFAMLGLPYDVQHPVFELRLRHEK